VSELGLQLEQTIRLSAAFPTASAGNQQKVAPLLSERELSWTFLWGLLLRHVVIPTLLSARNTHCGARVMASAGADAPSMPVMP
jgi:hypothetical protein